jgi:predicted negative regulator of RcsB-dependent stress response
LKAIEMWADILGAAVVILGIYCFLVLVGFRTWTLTRKTDRTAESMYDNYADPISKQQKYAKEHGTRRDDGSPVP